MKRHGGSRAFPGPESRLRQDTVAQSGRSVAALVGADEGPSWGTTAAPVLSRAGENGGLRPDTVARSGRSAGACVGADVGHS